MLQFKFLMLLFLLSITYYYTLLHNPYIDIDGIVLPATNILKQFQTTKYSSHILECFNGFSRNFQFATIIVQNPASPEVSKRSILGIKQKNCLKIWRLQIFSVSLHKIGGARQFESKLSLRSLAQSLQYV